MALSWKTSTEVDPYRGYLSGQPIVAESNSLLIERSKQMANIIFEEITQYRAYIYVGIEGREAFIHLLTANASIYINFYKEGVQLQENRSPIIQGRQYVYLHIHYNDYPNMIDLLRNEEPIYFFYRDDAKFGYLSTSAEPVGEHELEN
jgi:hypothetical protein